VVKNLFGACTEHSIGAEVKAGNAASAQAKWGATWNDAPPPEQSPLPAIALLPLLALSLVDTPALVDSPGADGFAGVSGFNFYRLDLVSLANGIHHIHIVCTTKYCVDAIQVRLGRVADKELATAGIFARMGH
jgi:hypothetical protein